MRRHAAERGRCGPFGRVCQVLAVFNSELSELCNGNANVVMVTQNRFSGGAKDRFFGGAREGYLAILGFKRVFGQDFLAGS